MDDQHHQEIQKADADHALLAVIAAPILEQHQRTIEHFGRIGKVQPMLGQIGVPLGLIPCVAHKNYTHSNVY